MWEGGWGEPKTAELQFCVVPSHHCAEYCFASIFFSFFSSTSFFLFPVWWTLIKQLFHWGDCFPVYLHEASFWAHVDSLHRKAVDCHKYDQMHPRRVPASYFSILCNFMLLFLSLWHKMLLWLFLSYPEMSEFIFFFFSLMQLSAWCRTSDWSGDTSGLFQHN